MKKLTYFVLVIAVAGCQSTPTKGPTAWKVPSNIRLGNFASSLATFKVAGTGDNNVQPGALTPFSLLGPKKRKFSVVLEGKTVFSQDVDLESKGCYTTIVYPEGKTVKGTLFSGEKLLPAGEAPEVQFAYVGAGGPALQVKLGSNVLATNVVVGKLSPSATLTADQDQELVVSDMSGKVLDTVKLKPEAKVSYTVALLWNGKGIVSMSARNSPITKPGISVPSAAG